MKGITRITVFALLVSMMTIGNTGCTNQTTIAALVTTLGNASAAVASLEGNPTLAAKLQADTQAASTSILNWKTGTPSQNAVEAIGIVEDDLNLICDSVPAPQCVAYEPLIVLALSTAQSIIAILNPAASTAQAHIAGRVSTVPVVGAPKTSSDFKKQWNNAVKENPAALGKLAIQ